MTCVILVFNHFAVKIYEKSILYERVHVVVTMLFVCVVSFILIKGMNQSPNSDALAIYNIAKSFLNDNYDAYAPIDSYLALFPFQTSFVFVMEMIMRITGKSGYFLFQCINVIYFAMIVAFVLWSVVELIRRWSWERAILMFALILAMSTVPGIGDYVYQKETGRNCGKGIPTLAVFAMGMQESNGVCGGWNGFHSDTFEKSGYDYEETLAISIEAVKERLDYFRDNKKYCLQFYKNKLIFQWAEPEYTSFYPLQISEGRDRAEWHCRISYCLFPWQVRGLDVYTR